MIVKKNVQYSAWYYWRKFQGLHLGRSTSSLPFGFITYERWLKHLKTIKYTCESENRDLSQLCIPLIFFAHLVSGFVNPRWWPRFGSERPDSCLLSLQHGELGRESHWSWCCFMKNTGTAAKSPLPNAPLAHWWVSSVHIPTGRRGAKRDPNLQEKEAEEKLQL